MAKIQTLADFAAYIANGGKLTAKLRRTWAAYHDAELTDADVRVLAGYRAGEVASPAVLEQTRRNVEQARRACAARVVTIC